MLRALAGLLWLAAGLVLVLFAMANRGLVAVSLDPFAHDAALSGHLPLFLVVFIAVIVGVVLGALADRVRSRRHARALQSQLRRRDDEARRTAAGEGRAQLPAPR
jgi:uncharacterized integral membrane protein